MHYIVNANYTKKDRKHAVFASCCFFGNRFFGLEGFAMFKFYFIYNEGEETL
jgi:hypothetical protein